MNYHKPLPKEQYERINAEMNHSKMAHGGDVKSVVDDEIRMRGICKKHNCTIDQYRHSHKMYGEGGNIAEENREMVANNNKQIRHHTEELEKVLKKDKDVPAWVVAKVNRSASDLSDATHYLDGDDKYAKGGKMSSITEANIKDLEGEHVEFHFMGVSQPKHYTLHSIRITPKVFTHRDVTMIFADGSDAILPLEKLDDFVSGKLITLKDYTGQQYGIKRVGKMAKGGVTELHESDQNDLFDVMMDARKLSISQKTNMYVFQRPSGEYVIADDEDSKMYELDKMNSRFVTFFANGKKYEDGGMVDSKDSFTLIFDGKQHVYDVFLVDGEFEDVDITTKRDTPLYQWIGHQFDEWLDNAPSDTKEMYYGDDDGNTYMDKRGAIVDAINNIASYIQEVYPNKVQLNLDKYEFDFSESWEYEKGGMMAKGGNVKLLQGTEAERTGSPSSGIEKDLLEKVGYENMRPYWVGNFGWRIESEKKGRTGDGYLFMLDDFDKSVVKHIKLKDSEHIFRYFNRTTAIGGMTPLIKINIDNGMLYFMEDTGGEYTDTINFEKRGVKALWVNLIQSKLRDPKFYAKGGQTRKEYIATKVGKVMHEFKEGSLRSGSGAKVTNPKQAIAIGLSEGRMGWKHKRKK